jgi:hypothetical protein
MTSTGKSERDFARGELAQAAGLVAVTSSSQARKAFDILGGAKAWRCLVAAVKEQASGADVRQRRLLLRNVGAPAFGRELRVSYAKAGVRTTLYLRLDVSRKGRAVVALMHMGMFAPALTIAEETAALRRMVERLP